MKKSLEYISFDGYVDTDEYLFYSCNTFNGLIKQSKENGSIEVSKFSTNAVFNQLLHHRVYRNGNELVFSPDFSHCVHTFDLDSNLMNYYVVKKDEWKNYRCACSYVWNNKLWMIFSFGENGIASLDLDTHKIDYYPDAYKTIRQYTEPNDVVFWSELCIRDKCVYGVINNKNCIVQINLEEISIKIIELEKDLHLSGITENNNYFFLTEYNTNEVLLYDISNKTIKKLGFPFGGLTIPSKGLMYSNIVSCGGTVLAVHNHMKSVFEITTEKIMKYGDFPDDQEDNNTDFRSKYRRFYSTFSDDNKVELYPARSNMMLTIDVLKKKITGRPFRFPSDWLKQEYENKIIDDYFKEYSIYNNPATESDMCDIKDFVYYLIKDL